MIFYAKQKYDHGTHAAFVLTWEDLIRAAEKRRVVVPRLLRREAAGDYVTVPGLLVLMEGAGWISPVVQRHRMTLFDQRQIDACIDRLAAGEFPEPPQSSTSASNTAK